MLNEFLKKSQFLDSRDIGNKYAYIFNESNKGITCRRYYLRKQPECGQTEHN